MQTNQRKLVILIVLVVVTSLAAGFSWEPIQEEKSPDPIQSSVANRVQKTLKERYHEEFGVKRVKFLKHTGVYVLYCYPKSDEDFVFEVKTGGYKYGNSIWDRYGSIKVSRNIDLYYRPIINKLFPYKKAFYTNGGTHTNWNIIPSFKEMLEDSKNTYTMPHIYIFEDIMEKDKEKFLEGILELVNLLDSQDLKRSGIYIYIYNEEFFKDIDPEWFMEATSWMSHDILIQYNPPEGMETDLHEYIKQLKNGFVITSKNYDVIKTIDDIENRVWQDK